MRTPDDDSSHAGSDSTAPGMERPAHRRKYRDRPLGNLEMLMAPAEPSRALPFKTAATIAWRELRASKTKFSFVILSVAIGVAALIGVRGFSESFHKTILAEARTIMAAGLSARVFRQPTPQEAK